VIETRLVYKFVCLSLIYIIISIDKCLIKVRSAYTEFKTTCKKICERQFNAKYPDLTPAAAADLLRDNQYIFADVRKSYAFFLLHIS
jgi:hypothetical protein